MVTSDSKQSGFEFLLVDFRKERISRFSTLQFPQMYSAGDLVNEKTFEKRNDAFRVQCLSPSCRGIWFVVVSSVAVDPAHMDSVSVFFFFFPELESSLQDCEASEM